MNASLMQFDDFADDAEAVRAAVIEGGFATETGPDGLPYRGISKHAVPQWFDLIGKAIGRSVIPRLSYFRLNLKGELPHSWVHSDEICANWACVLYLTEPAKCYGGTAFWKHTALGIDSMPLSEEVIEQGIDPHWFAAMMSREWKDLGFWEQAGFVAMKWNRFICYPTRLFHSRYPFEGFGETAQDGRLVWAGFFDLADA